MKFFSCVFLARLQLSLVKYGCGLLVLGFGVTWVAPAGAAPTIDYRASMRDFVMRISQTAKAAHSSFVVVAQDGPELLTQNGQSDGPAASNYVVALDGEAQEDVYYGYNGLNKKTSAADTTDFLAWLKTAKNFGLTPMVTDYCSVRAKVDDSYTKNAAQGWMSFAAPRLALDTVPSYPAPRQPRNSNAGSVTRLKDAKNFLYLINPQKYKTRAQLVAAVRATSYDAVVLDLYDNDGEFLTAADLDAMRAKPGGGTRLLLCYMSIGEAENYRVYWNKRWKAGNPAWLGPTDPDWPGNYAVKYWDTNWQNFIVGPSNSYLSQILAAKFDGVFLDKVDEFEYWEEHPAKATTSVILSETSTPTSLQEG